MTNPSSTLSAIHIILSVPAAVSEVPILLSSKTPSNTSENLGSQNYAQRPLAIAIGGGFNDEMFNQIKDACKDVPSAVWARTDISKMGKPPGAGEEESYGAIVAERVKSCLGQLRVGKEEGTSEGVYFF